MSLVAFHVIQFMVRFGYTSELWGCARQVGHALLLAADSEWDHCCLGRWRRRASLLTRARALLKRTLEGQFAKPTNGKSISKTFSPDC